MNEESKQEYATLVAKKSERLVTALYLVTDLMNDNEPIKHGIRKNAVTLLSSMNALSQPDVKDRIIEFKMSLKATTEILSLLHVSVTTGIVSEMNGQLLVNGFRSLQLILEKKQPILTEEMLAVDDEELGNSDNYSSTIATTSYDVLTPLALTRLHGNSRDIRNVEEQLRQSRIVAKMEQRDIKGQHGEVPIKDNFNKGTLRGEENHSVSNKNMGSVHSLLLDNKSKQTRGVSSSFQMRKNGRREQILALFVKGVDVSIKDIATRIRGCSEKTIQRELNSLLADNLIERIGEKRWSRYVLR